MTSKNVSSSRSFGFIFMLLVFKDYFSAIAACAAASLAIGTLNGEHDT